MAFADRRFSPVLVGVERPEERAKADSCDSGEVVRLAGKREGMRSSSSGEWLECNAVGPSGDPQLHELAHSPRCKVARFSIHEETQHFVIDDDSDDETVANRKGKHDTIPKRYRVRTKSKSWRLLGNRKR